MKIIIVLIMIFLTSCDSKHIRLDKNLYEQVYFNYNDATLFDFLNENENEIKQTTLFMGNRIIYLFKDDFYVEINLVDMQIDSNKAFKYNEREDFKIGSIRVYSTGIHEYKSYLYVNFGKK